MWCIGALTEEYRHRMYALLNLYARPVSKAEPVICIDEKKQPFDAFRCQRLADRPLLTTSNGHCRPSADLRR